MPTSTAFLATQSHECRKATWGDADVSAFAHLCREEHRLEAGAVARAKAAHDAAAEAVEKARAALTTTIRERYAGETAWGDKVRACKELKSATVE